MKLVALVEAGVEAEFGGKAMSLATALGAGLPVPDGWALGHSAVHAVVDEDPAALESLQSKFSQMRTPIAVRSSAVGEDSERASFAGQHITVLNVTSWLQLRAAIAKVVGSGMTPAARSYREKLGVEGLPRMGIVLQELLNPESAGVLFTRNPLTGANERVIESAWGLGESVVSGLVIPDHFRLAADGTILERRIGEKDLALQVLPEGGTEEVEVEAERVNASTLSDEDLGNLHALASRCESVYGEGLDIEWCLAEETLYLLQCRMITTSES